MLEWFRKMIASRKAKSTGKTEVVPGVFGFGFGFTLDRREGTAYNPCPYRDARWGPLPERRDVRDRGTVSRLAAIWRLLQCNQS